MASADQDTGQVDDVDHTTSPTINVTSETASTDSMITVRLSQPFPDLSPTAAQEFDPSSFDSDDTGEPTSELGRWDSIDTLQSNVYRDQNPDYDDIANAIRRSQSQSSNLSDDDNEPSFNTRYTSPFPPTITEDEEYDDVAANPWRPRSGSSGSDSGAVDWAGLDKTEQEEARDEASDESTAFLLARLEQENNALATDPRFGLKTRPRKQSRPPSMQVLKKLVQDPSTTRASRYSVVLNPPPMTELEFWAALVKDYPQTAQRLPTLTSNKIKSGIPPPLRGVVWVSMVGARDRDLEDQFDKLVQETSPYENLIGKDIGRSFPGVEMFREADGEGQQMLARVLKAFSLYDKEIGYCQGLGFLVGPLLMQMGDKDAFCVLVKLMENYDLRSCFLPDLSGLHLRIYQFKHLLDQHMPVLAAHLASLQVEAAYLSQWFLSFFAVTCPLPMLFRIYDVIFAEGASETIMRVALSLMKRNSERIMASYEFEEVMHLLLSRSLWEPYACDADDLVNDFGEMNSIVTRESLKFLETSFKHAHVNDPGTWYAFLPDATSAASRFLGRLWTASTPLKGGGLTPGQANGSHSRSSSFLRRSPSKQSISASINSTEVSSEGTNSVGTVTTDATAVSRDSSADVSTFGPKPDHVPSGQSIISKGDRDLHGQIEDLLTALSEMQRQHSLLTAQLQKEREERLEDHQAFETLLRSLRPTDPPKEEDAEERRRTVQYIGTTQNDSSDEIDGRRRTMPIPPAAAFTSTAPSADLQDLIQHANERIEMHRNTRQQRTSQILETKQRLVESLARSREQLEIETSRSTSLSQQLEDQTKQTEQARESLREVQSRLQEKIKERDSLERTIQDLTSGGSRRESLAWSDAETPPLLVRTDTGGSQTSITSLNRRDSASAGNSPVSPMETRPARSESLLTKALANGQLNASSPLPKRSSSLATQAVLSTPGHAPAAEEDLLVELVNVKTSEAVARQELEEVKAKLDAMRRMLGVESPPSIPQPSMLHRPSPSEGTVVPSTSGGVLSSAASFFKPSTSPSAAATAKDDRSTPPTVVTPGSAGATNGSGIAGSFWGWAKKSTTPTPAAMPAPEISEEQALAGAQGPAVVAESKT